MRLRYLQIDGKLVPADEATMKREDHQPFIQGTFEPFKSMIDGRMVTSKSQYYADCRAHGYEIVGDDVKYLAKPREIPDVATQQRKELLIAQIQEMGHDGFKKALKKDVEFFKWNSRGLTK